MSKRNHIHLTRYYHWAATLPFCLAVLAGIFLAASHEQDPKYVSEYFKDDGFRQTVILYILFSLALCALSFPIFLNAYKKISDQFVFSFLAWVFLPFFLLTFTFYRFIESSNTLSSPYEGNQSLDYFFVFIVLSHSLALLVSFFQFRRALATTAELHS